MFVALEEKNGYLFWCTNHGFYGYTSLAAPRSTSASSDLTKPFPIAGLEDHVSFHDMTDWY
jgi:hypothetical protein